MGKSAAIHKESKTGALFIINQSSFAASVICQIFASYNIFNEFSLNTYIRLLENFVSSIINTFQHAP